MDRAAIRQTLIELLEAETGTRYENLTDDTVLTEGLGLDSIDLVSLIVQVENRLRIKVSTVELKEISRVGQLLDLLEKLVREPGVASANGAPAVASNREPSETGGA